MLKAGFLLFCIFTLGFITRAQEPLDSQEKAKALIQSSINALGAKAYLSVKSERSQGLITPYREVKPDSNEVELDKLGTQSFTDYIILPNKERVEFKGQGRLFIQSNAEKQNWIYDSESESLREQTQAQQLRFARTLRYQVDKILRGGWMDPNVKLTYITRQEIWVHQYADGVRLTYPDDEQAEIFFDLQTKLPLALRFPKENYNGEKVKAENRFFKYIENNGIQAPYVVDLFENGKQTLRINYDTREFNVSIPEKIFIKPKNPKTIK
jgi:hypothetical protein